MSSSTYFVHPERGPHAVFITSDPNERSRLRRRGWSRINRSQAVTALGGGAAFFRATRHCSSGLIEGDRVDGRCLGHGASTEGGYR